MLKILSKSTDFYFFHNIWIGLKARDFVNPHLDRNLDLFIPTTFGLANSEKISVFNFSTFGLANSELISVFKFSTFGLAKRYRRSTVDVRLTIHGHGTYTKTIMMMLRRPGTASPSSSLLPSSSPSSSPPMMLRLLLVLVGLRSAAPVASQRHSIDGVPSR